MRAPIVGVKNDEGALEASVQGRKKEVPEHRIEALRHIKKRGVRLTMMGIISNAAFLLYQSTHGGANLSESTGARYGRRPDLL